MQPAEDPISEALSHVSRIREEVQYVFDACAGLPDSGGLVAARLRGVGAEVDALQAVWPRAARALAAAEGAAGGGDGALLDGKGGEQQQGAADAAAGKGTAGEAEAAREGGADDEPSPVPLAAAALSAAVAAETAAALLPSLEAATAAPPGAKRRRLAAAPPQPARATAGAGLAAVVEAVRARAPYLRVELMSSAANARAPHARHADEVRLLCPGVFSAAVALAGAGGAEPVRVAVDAADAAAGISGWSAPAHQVRMLGGRKEELFGRGIKAVESALLFDLFLSCCLFLFSHHPAQCHPLQK